MTRGTHLIAVGCIWALGVQGIQVLEMPAADGGIAWSVLAWALPGWCAVGIAMVFGVELGARRIRHPAIAAFAIGIAAIGMSMLWTALYTLVSDWLPSSEWAAVRVFDPAGAFAYQAWIAAFYGGWYGLAWSLHRRADGSRAMLARVEIARLGRRARAGAIELQSLRGRIDPALIQRVLAEARRRLERGNRSADALLTRLATFLRAAMPPASKALPAGHDATQHLESLLAELERTP